MYRGCNCSIEDCSSNDSLENCCIPGPPCCCKPIVKGKFGLAYIVQTPKTRCCQPLGWEVEFEDTPSKINNNCRKMVKWVNCPPLGGCQNIETHFCEYPKPCCDLLKQSNLPCCCQTYLGDFERPSNFQCKCCYSQKKARNKCCKCSKDTKQSFCCPAENKCRLCPAAENLCCCSRQNRQQCCESKKVDCRCKKKIETNCKCEDDTLDYIPNRDITVIKTTKTVKDSHTQSRPKSSRDKNERYQNTRNKSKLPNNEAEQDKDNKKTNNNEPPSKENSPDLEDNNFKEGDNKNRSTDSAGNEGHSNLVETHPTVINSRINDGKDVSEKEIINVIYDRTSESIPKSTDNNQVIVENESASKQENIGKEVELGGHPSIYENLTPLEKIRKARERQKNAIETSRNESEVEKSND